MTPLNDSKYALYPPWCLIESDPETFQNMTQMYGVRGVEVQEVLSLDNLLAIDRPVYGLIMSSALDLETLTEKRDKVDPDAESLFFSCQVVTNVCATSALLGVLLNIEDDDLVIGDSLQDFKDFTKDFSPVDRGMTIANSTLLQKTHNTFASFESKMMAQQYPKYDDIKSGGHMEEDSPNYHFVAFIPSKGYVWELDGYNKVPIKLHKITDNWLENIVSELKERMHESGDVNFNMLAITKSMTSSSATSTKVSLSSASSPPQNTSAIQPPTQEQNAIRVQHHRFYTQLLCRIEVYLDVTCWNWRQHTLEEHMAMDNPCYNLQNELRLGTITDIDQSIGRLIKSTAIRSEVISLLKLHAETRAHLFALMENSNGMNTNSGNDNRNKTLLRRQHDYGPLIETLFTKLDYQDLM